MRVPRLSIAWKISLWCLTLVAVFLVTLLLVFWRLQAVSQGAGQIVVVNQQAVDTSQALIQDLLDLLDDQKRFGILGKEEYRLAAREDLARFTRELESAAGQSPHPPQAWESIRRELRAHLGPNQPAEAPPLPEALVNTWLERLDAFQRQQREEIGSRLVRLRQQGEDAVRLGLLGLGASLLVALGGSALMALHLARSLGRLKRGIQGLGGEEGFRPIAARSRDELGDLAQAFNLMGGRLQEEERLRAEFISTLSHEIRTPLTSIREAVNLMREGVLGPVTPRQTQFLEMSSRESQRLSELLARLMQASSLEARDLALDLAPVEAGTLLEQAQARLEPLAQAKGISLGAQGPQGPLRVLADAEQVTQVLNNLVGNALKHAPQGSAVTLGLEPGDGQAVFWVRDQGPGIPPEEQPYVFEKYYRGAGEAQRLDGVGLGLAISLKVVKAHGGRMWLTSAPGQGSRFFFSLPLAGPEQAA